MEYNPMRCCDDGLKEQDRKEDNKSVRRRDTAPTEIQSQIIVYDLL
jgi:hypothetical protein